MEILAIVGGNDFRVRFPLMRHAVQATGEITRQPLDIASIESMSVFFEQADGCALSLNWYADPEREGNVIADVPANIFFGTYNLIVAGERDGGIKFRSKEKRQLRIVDNNERSNVIPTQRNGYDVYTLDTMAVLDARGRDGLSAYEVAVLNGFNGTEQEWLSSLAIRRVEKISTDWLVDTYRIYYANAGYNDFTNLLLSLPQNLYHPYQLHIYH